MDAPRAQGQHHQQTLEVRLSASLLLLPPHQPQVQRPRAGRLGGGGLRHLAVHGGGDVPARLSARRRSACARGGGRGSQRPAAGVREAGARACLHAERERRRGGSSSSGREDQAGAGGAREEVADETGHGESETLGEGGGEAATVL
eukprot:414563-Hanusia_phi.AAC.4